MGSFLDLATRLIGIDSVSTNGTEAMSNFLAVLFQAKGLSVQVQEVRHPLDGVSQKQFNVLGVLGDPLVDRKTRKGLLLQTHIDTASGGVLAHWTEGRKDPWVAHVDSGQLYGLGSSDAKLGLLCQLEAAASFRGAKLKEPIYLAGTCGEELGGFGARYLIQSGVVNPRYCVVTKPTQLRVVHAHPSSSNLEVHLGYSVVERGARGFNRRLSLHIQGRSGHPAYPRTAVSALSRMLEFVSSAQDAGFELKFTQVVAGTMSSQIPDWATAEIYLTSHQLEDFKRFFRESVIQSAGSGGQPMKMELGGTGDAGIRFLPTAVLPALIRLEAVTREFAVQNVAAGTVMMTQLRKTDNGLALSFDVRLAPEIDLKAMHERLTALWLGVGQEYPKLNLKVVSRWSNPGFQIPSDSEWVRQVTAALHDANLDRTVSRGIFGSEASLLAAKGYPAVVMGPGQFEGNAHCPNEKVSIVELEKCVAFYQKLIARACL